MAKSLRVLPSFHTCRELNLIAFRVIFSCYTQNQNILMRTIVLTNLLIKLLFSFNSLLLKKNSKGTAMDFAIISKESTAYDLQPLVCLRMLLSWKLYFKPLYLITGAHSPNCHPALYYQQSNNSMMLTTPTAPIWSRRQKSSAGLMCGYSLKEWDGTVEGGMWGKKKNHTTKYLWVGCSKLFLNQFFVPSNKNLCLSFSLRFLHLAVFGG